VTPAAERADRANEVRAAARAWRRAGAIDDPTLAAIEARYPDDRGRLGPIFRILAFGFTLLALNSCFGLLGLACSPGLSRFAGLAVLWGVALAAATEVLVGALKRADFGVEAATAFMAAAYLSAGVGVLAADPLTDDQAFVTFLAAALLACAAGAWRWGFAFLGGGAVLFLFLLLARISGGRALWIVAGVALAPVFVAGSESARLTPAHRRACTLSLGLVLLALYSAVHIGSLDGHTIERIADFRIDGIVASPVLRRLSIAATALVPLALLAFGVATRRTLFIYMGVLLGVASLVTLRFYVHVAPLWVVLTSSGAAALGMAIGVRRLLHGGADRERGGFTAEPLFDDERKRQIGEAVAAVASLSPEARVIPAEKTDGLAPRGGGYGGGGAGGDF
jgi:MFS family permease